jgi:hypothetical protein
MKNLIVLLCLVFFILGFKQDKKQSDFKENELNMGTRVITIQLDEAGTGLILNDGQSNGPNINTLVSVGDVIKWKLIPNAGIESLDSIKEKNINIFSIIPSKQSDGSLTGTVGDYPVGTSESYGIYYKVNGVTLYHDPVIQVH